MNQTFNVGDRVRILSARHPDVNAGTVGTIDGYYEGGYGVVITGSWLIAGGDRGQSQSGTQVIWYPPEKLEPV